MAAARSALPLRRVRHPVPVRAEERRYPYFVVHDHHVASHTQYRRASQVVPRSGTVAIVLKKSEIVVPY